MTVAVFGAPPVAPPAPRPRRPGLQHHWTDWTGRVWALSDYRSGAFLTDSGIRGMHLPPQTDHIATAAGVDGQSLRSFRVEARDVLWPVYIYSDEASDQWLTHDASWWRGLQPGRHGTWTVTTQNGSRRHLRMRGTGGADHAYRRDPSVSGWELYGVRALADDPYWYGDPVSASVGDEQVADFIDPDGSPPLHISGGLALAGLELSNDGDVAAWPVWTAIGPHPDLVLGVGDAVIEAPPLAAGERLVIDTSPWVRTALIDGVDATDSLGAADFRPVPPAGTVKLVASSSGSSQVSCEIRPRYYRAW